MSQFAPPDDVSFAPTTEQAPRTSGLAVWALVCSLVFCCPLTTVLGALLGVIALASIKSKPHLRGAGLAVAAIVIGLLLSAGWVWVGTKSYGFVARMMEHMRTGVPQAIMDGAAGDTTAFKSEMYGPGATATDAEVEAFFETLESRYGALQSVAFDDQGMAGQRQPWGSPIVPFPYDFQFADGARSATVEVVFADQSTGQFVYKMQSIVVHDPDEGDVHFPPPGD